MRANHARDRNPTIELYAFAVVALGLILYGYPVGVTNVMLGAPSQFQRDAFVEGDVETLGMLVSANSVGALLGCVLALVIGVIFYLGLVLAPRVTGHPCTTWIRHPTTLSLRRTHLTWSRGAIQLAGMVMTMSTTYTGRARVFIRYPPSRSHLKPWGAEGGKFHSSTRLLEDDGANVERKRKK